MGFLKTLIGFAIALILAGFALQNRNVVDVQYSPLHAPLELPIYLLALGCALLGFMLGAVIVWLNDGHLRREKRRQTKQIKTLESDLADLKSADSKHAPAAELFPALPKK